MSTSERVQLWAMRGLTAAEITHQTKLPRSTVKYHLKRFKETGSWSRREYPVRVKTLTPFAECIRKHLKLHPHASATELHELLATKFQLMVSVRTVQRYLKSAGREAKGLGGQRGLEDNSGAEEESDTSTTEELSVGSGGEQASVSKMKIMERVSTSSYQTTTSSEDDTRAMERRRTSKMETSSIASSSSSSATSTSTAATQSSSHHLNQGQVPQGGHHGQHAHAHSHLRSSFQASSRLSQAAFSASSSSSLSQSTSSIVSSMSHPPLTLSGAALAHSSNQLPSACSSPSSSSPSSSAPPPSHLPPVLPHHLPFGILPHYPLLMPPASLQWQDFTPSPSSALHPSLSHHYNTHGATAPQAAVNAAAAPPVSALPLMNPLGLFPIYPPFNTHNASDSRSKPLPAHSHASNHGAAATASLISPKVEPSLEALINAALVSD